MSYEAVKSVIVLIAVLVAGVVFCWQLYQRLWLSFEHGQPSGPFGHWGERIKGVLVFVGGQRRLFRFLVPGTAHFFIFWGFLLLFPTILQAILEGLVAFTNPNFVLPVLGNWGPLALLQDVFTFMVAIAVAYDLYVRLAVDQPQTTGHGCPVVCPHHHALPVGDERRSHQFRRRPPLKLAASLDPRESDLCRTEREDSVCRRGNRLLDSSGRDTRLPQ